ncbi:MAG: L-threonylcarbamoyladenylate synthase [Syntrophobacteria bacterium]
MMPLSILVNSRANGKRPLLFSLHSAFWIGTCDFFAMPLILKTAQEAPQNQETIGQAAEIVLAGGIVAFPTETFYGVAALASHPGAVEHIYRLKRRPPGKPVSILVSDLAQLRQWVHMVPTGVPQLMERFWPGPLTLVFTAAKHLPASLHAGTGKVGVRISSHPVAQALVRAVGTPITATSANRADAPSCRSAAEVLGQLGPELDAILDGGLTLGSKASTIVDVTARPPEILRFGAIAAREILRCWQQTAQSSCNGGCQ